MWEGVSFSIMGKEIESDKLVYVPKDGSFLYSLYEKSDTPERSWLSQRLSHIPTLEWACLLSAGTVALDFKGDDLILTQVNGYIPEGRWIRCQKLIPPIIEGSGILCVIPSAKEEVVSRYHCKDAPRCERYPDGIYRLVFSQEGVGRYYRTGPNLVVGCSECGVTDMIFGLVPGEYVPNRLSANS